VSGCWIYQIYDSGVTFQYGQEFPEVSVIMEDVYFTNNVIEKCGGSFECWVAGEDWLYPEGVSRYMKNIYVTGNLLADAGYGFSAAQRPDHGNETLFMGFFHWNNREGDYIIENNLFLRSKFTIMNIGADHAEDLPELKNNIFVHTDKQEWGRYTQNIEGKEQVKVRYTYEEISRPEYAGNRFYVIPYSE